MTRRKKKGYQSPDVSIDEKFRRVKALLRPGRISDHFDILEVRRDGDAAVILVRSPDEPRPFGLVIDLADTTHEFYYDDYPVASFEEWLEYLDVYVMVSLDTGVTVRSDRVDRGDYLEIREGPEAPADP